MITLSAQGDWSRTFKFFAFVETHKFLKALDQYGKRGVDALSSATPIESGETASGWSYEIHRSKNRITLDFMNDNIVDGCQIAIILQYGHATRNGSWVEGRDYINPAIQPIFDDIANTAWKELTRR